ncbi:MAG TPA: transposase, partial [Acidobacteriota bacterium]|nr:transposase [Acidobacteriota bacterium]
FHRVSCFNDPLLCRFFTLEVFSLLLRKQLINKDLVQKIMHWRHTGFNVHSKVRTESKEETERVGKYMIRPILSLKRLTLDEAQGQVVYKYGKHSSETESMDYLEFIARVTSHIPDKGQVMVRYYGLCKALHKLYYAEFKIMLSYYGNTLIFNRLRSMILSIITGSRGRIKWNHYLYTARLLKMDSLMISFTYKLFCCFPIFL